MRAPHHPSCVCRICSALRRWAEEYASQHATFRTMPTAGWSALSVACPHCGVEMTTTDGGEPQRGHWLILPLAADVFLHSLVGLPDTPSLRLLYDWWALDHCVAPQPPAPPHTPGRPRRSSRCWVPPAGAAPRSRGPRGMRSPSSARPPGRPAGSGTPRSTAGRRGSAAPRAARRSAGCPPAPGRSP